jgi:hypothetical protein
VDVEVAPGAVDDPDLGYPEAGVERQLDAAIVCQARLRDLDQEQAVIRPRMRLFLSCSRFAFRLRRSVSGSDARAPERAGVFLV